MMKAYDRMQALVNEVGAKKATELLARVLETQQRYNERTAEDYPDGSMKSDIVVRAGELGHAATLLRVAAGDMAEQEPKQRWQTP